MDRYLEESLRLAREWLDSVPDDEFAQQYLSFEKNLGPTVDEFISTFVASELEPVWIDVEVCEACNDTPFYVDDDTFGYDIAA